VLVFTCIYNLYAKKDKYENTKKKEKKKVNCEGSRGNKVKSDVIKYQRERERERERELFHDYLHL
jgi:hypothetical protein